MNIKEGRLFDAYRHIAQEAKALLLSGKIDNRHEEKLRAAFARLDAAIKRSDEENTP